MDLYHFIYFTILFCGIIVGLVRYGVLNSNSKIMFFLLILTITSEGVTLYQKLYAEPNFIVYHLYQPIEIIVIGIAFWNEIRSKLIIYLVLANCAFSVINSLYLQPYDLEFNSNAFLIQSCTFIVLSLWYLQRLLVEKSPYIFVAYPMFWISMGFALFNIINLFVLGTHNAIANLFPEINSVFRIVRFISNYFLYIIFIISFLSSQRKLNAE